MRDTLERILLLQTEYSSLNTPAMQERGRLIRDQLRSELDPVARAGGFAVEGRDATGRKSRVPWVRVYDRERSPSAQEGWYLGYLFHSEGTRVVLSIMQGTTEFIDGEFRSRPSDVLARRVAWARLGLQDAISETPGSTSAIDLGEGDLAKGYAEGHVFGRAYELPLPSEEVLQADYLASVALLKKLYALEDVAFAPTAGDAVVQSQKASIEGAVGRTVRRGAPRGLSAAERRAIELHAMERASAHLEALGWSLVDTHDNKPYDFVGTKDDATIYVEVKGTTTSGSTVILTRNEVDHHTKHHPDTWLVVVSEIVLQPSPEGVACTGGVIRAWSGWRPELEALSALAYEYQLPSGGATS